MKLWIQKIPDQCDICKDPIKLYQPYYTVKIKKTIGGVKFKQEEQHYLCPNCFDAYKDFIIERTVQENHKKTMQDMKGAIKK